MACRFSLSNEDVLTKKTTGKPINGLYILFTRQNINIDRSKKILKLCENR